MPRYFIEVSYKGSNYSGFQSQKNANTIQAEVERALSVLFHGEFLLTSSSRTDAGVHARQNYFHFDAEASIETQILYNLNAILPHDIVVKNIIPVSGDAHCRFDAIARTYQYFIYRAKDPFLADRAYYYPFALDVNKLNMLASVFLMHENFASFSKRNSQVKTFNCKIVTAEWTLKNDSIIFTTEANRYLRGMVRGMVATMLHLAKEDYNIERLHDIIIARNCINAYFSAPPWAVSSKGSLSRRIFLRPGISTPKK